MEKAIFGAGRNGETILAGLRAGGHTVDYFIDDNMAGQTLDTVPIITYADSADRPARVYVSVVPQRNGLNNRTLHDEVCSDLYKLDHDVVDFVATLQTDERILHKYFNRSILWMSHDTHQMVNDDGIKRFRDLLSDEKSQQILDQIVRLRRTKDMEHYVLPDESVEYFPNDLPILDKLSSIKFADCGAYTGDTVCDLLQHANKPIEHITCFEPDIDNLNDLKHTVNQLVEKEQINSAHIYPCGVWSTNTIARFASGNGSSSAISDLSLANSSVPMVSLDTVLAGARPNYIKMDIEGAEREALMGARRIIEQVAPVLAICVYHKPADLWKLPLLIHDMQPSYKMGLRVHGHLGLSTILYCYNQVSD